MHRHAYLSTSSSWGAVWRRQRERQQQQQRGKGEGVHYAAGLLIVFVFSPLSTPSLFSISMRVRNAAKQEQCGRIVHSVVVIVVG